MPRKCQPLADWLAAQPGPSVCLAFAQVEQLLGTPLPSSARANTAWWQDTGTGRPHIHAWRGLGWQVAAVNRRQALVLYHRPRPGEHDDGR